MMLPRARGLLRCLGHWLHRQARVATLCGAIGISALVLVASAPTIAAQATPGASPGLPQDSDLTLGGAAGRVLVGVTVRPGQPGSNTLLVYVLPPEGPAAAADVSLSLAIDGQPVPLEFCSRSCRTAEVTLNGGEHLELFATGQGGGAASFDLPASAFGEWESIAAARARAHARVGHLSSR